MLGAAALKRGADLLGAIHILDLLQGALGEEKGCLAEAGSDNCGLIESGAFHRSSGEIGNKPNLEEFCNSAITDATL